VQAGYKAQTLSAFLGTPAPKAAPAIDFIKPLTPAEEKTALQFFNILNFVLQFCPTHPSEKALMARFAKIGVGAGKTFDASKLSPEMKAAIEQGMADAWADFAGLEKQVAAGKVTPGDVFGTREYLKNNYLYRMTAAVLGIYGNSKEEAMYPPYYVDATKEKLTGANHPDGGLTLIVQNESPGKDKEANWLPAPKGPFSMIMRLYWPKEAATQGKWTAPPLKRAS
jgi:hypothetical protein